MIVILLYIFRVSTMFYSYDLLCAHKSGKYALLWSLANNMKKISLQKILEADLFTSW